MDDSFQVPGPSAGDYLSDGIEEGDEDYNDQFNDDDADGVYQDWLATVDREDKKMMALMLPDNYFKARIVCGYKF